MRLECDGEKTYIKWTKQETNKHCWYETAAKQKPIFVQDF